MRVLGECGSNKGTREQQGRAGITGMGVVGECGSTSGVWEY